MKMFLREKIMMWFMPVVVMVRAMKRNGRDMNHCTMMSQVRNAQKRDYLKRILNLSGRKVAVGLSFTLMQHFGNNMKKQTLMRKLQMIGMWIWKFMKIQV